MRWQLSRADMFFSECAVYSPHELSPLFREARSTKIVRNIFRSWRRATELELPIRAHAKLNTVDSKTMPDRATADDAWCRVAGLTNGEHADELSDSALLPLRVSFAHVWFHLRRFHQCHTPPFFMSVHPAHLQAKVLVHAIGMVPYPSMTDLRSTTERTSQG